MLEILLVDDEPATRMSVASALYDAGHRITEAADGAEAMALASSSVFDVAICDVRLPKVDGLTLFRHLRRESPGTAVILMTAYATIQDAVTALRLATCGPVAAGPVLFERLDWRPFGVRPVLPIAATQPPGEPTRLDVFRGETARLLLGKLGAAEDDRGLGDALDRWELALFQDGSFQAEQLRSSLEALLGNGDGAWAASLRTAVLLGETGRERQDCLLVLRRLCEGVARPEAADLVRRALVVTVTRGEREQLVAELDESLLGVRPTPSSRVAQALAS